MKSLLIIGAGGHGSVVREIAELCGYDRIAFLDDNDPHAIGKIHELSKFLEYENAFVAIGNNLLRSDILDEAIRLGYNIPVLIHPYAYVSPSAKIGKGTVVEAMSVINTEALIGQGCIVSVGSVVDHHAVVGDCAHINAGSIVKAGGHVDRTHKLEAGEVIFGYPSAIVKKG